MTGITETNPRRVDSTYLANFILWTALKESTGKVGSPAVSCSLRVWEENKINHLRDNVVENKNIN